MTCADMPRAAHISEKKQFYLWNVHTPLCFLYELLEGVRAPLDGIKQSMLAHTAIAANILAPWEITPRQVDKVISIQQQHLFSARLHRRVTV